MNATAPTHLPSMKAVGSALAAARARAEMSMGRAARLLGVTRQTVSRWENGHVVPSAVNLIALSRLYGESIEEVLGIA